MLPPQLRLLASACAPTRACVPGLLVVLHATARVRVVRLLNSSSCPRRAGMLHHVLPTSLRIAHSAAHCRQRLPSIPKCQNILPFYPHMMCLGTPQKIRQVGYNT